MWCFHSRRDMGTSEGASHARQPRRPITAQVPASSGVPDVPPAVVGQGQSPPAPGPAAVRRDSVLPWVAAWWFCWWIFTGPGGQGAASGELPSHRKRGLLRGSRRGRGGVISPLPAFTPSATVAASGQALLHPHPAPGPAPALPPACPAGRVPCRLLCALVHLHPPGWALPVGRQAGRRGALQGGRGAGLAWVGRRGILLCPRVGLGRDAP